MRPPGKFNPYGSALHHVTASSANPFDLAPTTCDSKCSHPPTHNSVDAVSGFVTQSLGWLPSLAHYQAAASHASLIASSHMSSPAITGDLALPLQG